MWAGWKGTRQLSLYCEKLALNCELSDGDLAVLFLVCFSKCGGGGDGEKMTALPTGKHGEQI